MTSPQSKASPAARVRSGLLLDMSVRSAVVLALLAVPLGAGVGPVAGNPSAGESAADAATTWKASYSERFPGCVPSVLWPTDEQPVAVITKTSDGQVERVALDPQRRALLSVAQGARTIGACR